MANMTVNISAGDTQRPVNDTGVEVHIGIQFSFDEIGVAKATSSMAIWRYKYRIIYAQFLEYIVGCFFDDLALIQKFL